MVREGNRRQEAAPSLSIPRAEMRWVLPTSRYQGGKFSKEESQQDQVSVPCPRVQRNNQSQCGRAMSLPCGLALCGYMEVPAAELRTQERQKADVSEI